MSTLLSITDSEHTFEKNNLVTQTSGNLSFDTYECVHCHLMGRRVGVSEFIEVTANTTCTATKSYKQHLIKLNVNKNVTVSFGLINNSIVVTVPCPIDQRAKYVDSIWVNSPSRNEPVRLHHTEYEIVEKPIEWFVERIGKVVFSENISNEQISDCNITDANMAKMLYNKQFKDGGYLFE